MHRPRNGTPVERRGRKAREPRDRDRGQPSCLGRHPLWVPRGTGGASPGFGPERTEHHMLARIRKAMDENESGFTLIELLVVMIIIGILAAIAIPVFLNQRKNAVDASYKSDLRTVANEMESYFTDNEVYPTTGPSNTAAGLAVTGVGGPSGVRVSKNTKID